MINCCLLSPEFFVLLLHDIISTCQSIVGIRITCFSAVELVLCYFSTCCGTAHVTPRLLTSSLLRYGFLLGRQHTVADARSLSFKVLEHCLFCCRLAPEPMNLHCLLGVFCVQGSLLTFDGNSVA